MISLFLSSLPTSSCSPPEKVAFNSEAELKSQPHEEGFSVREFFVYRKQVVSTLEHSLDFKAWFLVYSQVEIAGESSEKNM